MNSKNNWITIVVLCAVMALIVSGAILRLNKVPQLSDLLRLATTEYPEPRDFDWPYLTDEQSDIYLRSEFNDRWHLVFFGFTNCPDICPATMSLFAQMAKRLDNDALSADTRYIMISVDPTRDTTERLATWIKNFNLKFKALRGDISLVRSLARDFGVAFQKTSFKNALEYNINHSGNVFLVGPNGKQYAFVRPENAQQLEQAYRSIRLRSRI